LITEYSPCGAGHRLFIFIIKPFTGQSLMRLFSTHPSTEDRIARLQAMR